MSNTMADTEAQYMKVSEDGVDSQRSNNSRILKVGIVLIGGSCLVLLSVMAIYAYGPSASVDESTSLLAVPAALRSLKPIPLSPTQLKAIPGPSPWKEMAIAGIESANQCIRGDVSTNANPVQKAYAVLSTSMQKEVSSVGQAIVAKAKDLEAGQTAPMGFFDPLGFSTKVDGEKLFYYREAEIKHGRVCMLAFVGYLMSEVYQPILPGIKIGSLGYEQFTNKDLNSFWLLLFVTVAIPEFLYSVPTLNGFGKIKQGRIPGDFGFDPLYLKEGLAMDFVDMQNKELNNGRLAMLAVVGMIGQELAQGGTELAYLTPNK